MASAAKAQNIAVASQIWASRAVLVANLRGNSTKQCNSMRIELSKVGGHLKFLKNSLAQVALSESKNVGLHSNREAMSALLNGQVCLLYSDAEDPMALFKVAKSLEAKNEEFAIIGGAFDATLLTRDGVRKAAALPPVIDLQAQLITALQGPSIGLASALEAPKFNTARALTMALERPAKDFARSADGRAKQLDEK